VRSAPLQRRILLVGSPSRVGAAIADAIRRAGHCLSVARTFQAAKVNLGYAPDLVVTELKLGEYNGLQLAMRSLAAGIPAVVIADESFAREVERLGAVWLSRRAASTTDIQSVLARALQGRARDHRGGWFETPTDRVPLDEPHRAVVLH
jgi:DNA-binding NtrC family response regulator